jgi:alkylation response protein AidB-like acyl-CoA dehydrogenase
MDFSFTEEQSMLRDTVASYLADHYSFDQRRALLAKEPGWSPAIWKAFAEELGILGRALLRRAGRPGRRPGREHDRHGGDG